MKNSLNESGYPHGVAAVDYQLRVTVRREGATVICDASGSHRREAERSVVTVAYGKHSISRPLEPDAHAWRELSIEDRARLLESYVHDLIRDSGWLDVAAGSKVD